MKKAIIAVDAGGTKIHTALIGGERQIIESVYGDAGSPATVGIDKAFSNIFDTIQQIYQRFFDHYDITLIQLGVSGLGIVPVPKDYEKNFSDYFKVPVSIKDDGLLALHSLKQNRPGHWVTIISGTGSCCYGTNDKDVLLLGGFGHLLTEAGSAYSSVKKVMFQAIKEFEENEPMSNLSRAFLDAIGAKNVYGLKVFAFNNTKGTVAAYAKLISKLALSGDEKAIFILKESGRELGRWIKLMYKHLQLEENTIVGFRGSFIEKAAFVMDELICDLHQDGLFPRIIKSTEDPIYGAYYMAKKEGLL